MSRFHNKWHPYLLQLPLTAHEYDPITCEIKLPTQYMTASSASHQAVSNNQELLQAQGFDPSDIDFALSGETEENEGDNEKVTSTPRGPRKQQDPIMKAVNKEAEKTRTPTAPVIDPETLLKANPRQPQEQARKNADGASVDTRDTNVTGVASVNRPDSTFRWSDSLKRSEQKCTEAQQQARKAETEAHEAKTELERLREALRSQNIDPDLISSGANNGPKVNFSSSSNTDFPPLSTASETSKKEGAGTSPQGEPQHQSK